MMGLRCWLGRHNYRVLEVYSKDIRKVGCKCCSKVWGMNDDVRAFVPWDRELEIAMTILFPMGPVTKGEVSRA